MIKFAVAIAIAMHEGRKVLCDGCRSPPCACCQRTERPVKQLKYDVEVKPLWFCGKKKCKDARRKDEKQKVKENTDKDEQVRR